jgi:hypothetical protein
LEAFEIVRAENSPSFSLQQRHNSTGEKPVFIGDSDTFPIQLWDQNSKQPRAFTADEIKSLSDGKTYIATFGIVAYSDAFGLHWYRFCQWTSYAQEATVNAAACVNWNTAGDGNRPSLIN